MSILNLYTYHSTSYPVPLYLIFSFIPNTVVFVIRGLTSLSKLGVLDATLYLIQNYFYTAYKNNEKGSILICVYWHLSVNIIQFLANSGSISNYM